MPRWGSDQWTATTTSNEILSRAFPQGSRLIRLEGGGRLIYTAARDLIGNPDLAVEVLGPRGATALARAVGAIGQRHMKVAERMLELAAERAGEESAPEKRHSGHYNPEG